MSPRRGLTPALQILTSSVALAVVSSGLVAAPSTAAPSPPSRPATPEVRQLRIPAVAAQPPVQANGPRRAGRVIAALPQQRTSRFSTVGVTWAPGTSGAPQVEIRVRTGGRWSSWRLLEDDSQEGPSGPEALKARPGTAPLWVGDSDGVQVRMVSTTATASAPSDAAVSLIDPKTSPEDEQVGQMATTSDTTSMPNLTKQPTVVSRAAWGADERLRSYNGADCARPRYTSTIRAAIVHHTAGSNSYTAETSAAQVRGIYAFHVKSRGWCDIGYNFLVDKYGRIFEGRYGGITKPVHGAHATYWNTDTVGVSLMGNFDTAQPTDTMIASMNRLLAWKLEGNYRNPSGTVVLAGKKINTIAGHGDVMATACPGVNVRSRMGAIRTSVTTKVGSYNTPIYRRWQALGGEAGWVGSPFVGEHVLGTGRVTRFAGADLFYNPSFGTFWIKGRNRSLYRSLGEVNHYLGWPTSDEVSGVLGSKVNYFQSGGIYYSSATGSQPIYRAFYTYYSRLGANVARLGLPIAAQRPGAVAGSQVQRFANGGLYWTSTLGTQEVNGAIYRRYVGLGGEKSSLGMPTRGDYAVPSGRATDFQGGRITWNATTNTTTVTYR